MTTDIPPSITTPDKVETGIGTVKFFDGFPEKATVEMCYDNLDFQRGVTGTWRNTPCQWGQWRADRDYGIPTSVKGRMKGSEL